MLDSGKDPVGFAASIFYFVTTKSGISEYGFQTKVCDIFNVPRQTLNRNFKAIMNAIGSVSLA